MEDGADAGMTEPPGAEEERQLALCLRAVASVHVDHGAGVAADGARYTPAPEEQVDEAGQQGRLADAHEHRHCVRDYPMHAARFRWPRVQPGCAVRLVSSANRRVMVGL
jgi:hypothetical protein